MLRGGSVREVTANGRQQRQRWDTDDNITTVFRFPLVRPRNMFYPCITPGASPCQDVQ